MYALEVLYDNMPKFIGGFWLTLQLVFISIIIGSFVAFFVCAMRLSNRWYLKAPAYSYIFFFRGTPLLVQIFMIYYGFAQIDFIRNTPFLWEGFFREAYWCAIFALTLNTAAYMAEIFRGAMQAVPVGEVEAAKAIGMSRGMMLRRIKIPEALRICIPAYSNEIILLLKGSALASTITLMDLTGVAKTINSRTFLPFEVFIMAGLFYFFISSIVLYSFKRLEKRMKHI